MEEGDDMATMEERGDAAAAKFPTEAGELLVTLTDKIEQAGDTQQARLELDRRYAALRKEIESLMQVLNLDDVGSGRFVATFKPRRLSFIKVLDVLRKVKKHKTLEAILTVNLTEAKAVLSTAVYSKLEQRRDGPPVLNIRERKDAAA
jgi:hypothetical protein